MTVIKDPPNTNKGVKKSYPPPRQLPEKIISVGCDYLMATTTSLDTSDKWQNVWMMYLRGLGKNAALNARDGYWRGYHTRELPGLMVGVRKDGAIIRMTGETASVLYQVVEPYVSKLTRIDLQVTYEFLHPYPALAQLYREVLLESGYKKTSKPAILNDDGQTLYLGSMSSPHFARIYDRAKSERLSQTGVRWRYEVVWRNEKAQRVFRKLREYPKWDDKLSVMYAIVYNWFENHWCDLPMGKPPQYIEMVSIGAKIQTRETKLNWLRSTVKPTVFRLMDAGVDKSDILDALGLSPVDM